MYNGIPNMVHKKNMREALNLAHIAFREGEVPIGAVVVFQQRIVGKGYNQVEVLGDATAHAEMIAISAASSTIGTKYLRDCSIYVTLEPCMMCAGALVWSKIEKIVFGALDEKAGSAGSVFNIASNNKLNHQVEIIQGVLEDECSSLIKQFFRDRR